MRKFLVVLFTMLCVGSFYYIAYAEEFGLDDLLDDEYDDEVIEIWDPLEPINRVVFECNDKFYLNILDPISEAYSYILPLGVRNAAGNLVHEVAMPIRAVSSLIQLDITDTILEISATLLNLTWGFISPLWGDEMFGMVKLEIDAEDLGQSLGFWGVPHGPYIVWPFFGPSSLRDSLGSVGECYVNPVSYLGDFETHLSIESGDAINEWSLTPDRYSFIVEGVPDPYISLRSAYMQNRDALLKE